MTCTRRPIFISYEYDLWS